MYANGMSVRDIAEQLQALYGIELPRHKMRGITKVI